MTTTTPEAIRRLQDAMREENAILARIRVLCSHIHGKRRGKVCDCRDCAVTLGWWCPRREELGHFVPVCIFTTHILRDGRHVRSCIYCQAIDPGYPPREDK